MKLPRNFTQRGQALIIILLGMAAVLALVLSAVSTSVTDISVSEKDEEAARALNAAEAGVERSFLLSEDSDGGFPDNDSTYTADISGVAENQTYYNSPKSLTSGDTAALWLVSHDGNALRCDAANGFPCVSNSASLKVCFGDSGTSVVNSPAIEISAYYVPAGLNPTNFSGVLVARAVYDPNASRIANNNFTLANGGNCTLGTSQYAFSTPTFTLGSIGVSCLGANCPLVVKAKAIYNNLAIPVGFSLSENLPAQGIRVVSTGLSGESTRKLEVVRSFKEIPAIFENSVFSLVNLIK